MTGSLLLALGFAWGHPPGDSGLAYSYPATVTRPAYDGDTHYYELLLGEIVTPEVITRSYQRTGVRQLWVNTPEVHLLATRAEGHKVRDYVRRLLEEALEIHVHTDGKRDSFGRLLAEVWLLRPGGESLDLGAHLLEVGYAVEFRR